MQITIISVGKLKEKYLKQGIEEFRKRLTPYCKLHLLEVVDEQAPEELSAKAIEQVKEKEGERILAKLKAEQYVIALVIDGVKWSSEELATELARLGTYGKSNVAFVIGGSNGLGDNVLRRANHQLSFSRMTFPHQLMRLILLEQIYRAFKIIKGEPYHK